MVSAEKVASDLEAALKANLPPARSNAGEWFRNARFEVIKVGGMPVVHISRLPALAEHQHPALEGLIREALRSLYPIDYIRADRDNPFPRGLKGAPDRWMPFQVNAANIAPKTTVANVMVNGSAAER